MKSQYTSEEWDIISNIAQLTGLLMSTAAYSGIEGTKSELKAAVNGIIEGAEMYPDNTLINAVIPKGNDNKETLKNIVDQQNKLISGIEVNDRVTLDIFQVSVYQKLHQFIFITSEKENALTVNGFKLWLLKIAEDVAVSAIEETVFGKQKDPFCEEERIVFNKISRLLKNLV